MSGEFLVEKTLNVHPEKRTVKTRFESSKMNFQRNKKRVSLVQAYKGHVFGFNGLL